MWVATYSIPILIYRERFVECLMELSLKGQRTVYRLTIVKGFNESEIENYANLVEIGSPDFIEVKGVTYCGTSKGKIYVFKVGCSNRQRELSVLFHVHQGLSIKNTWLG